MGRVWPARSDHDWGACGEVRVVYEGLAWRALGGGVAGERGLEIKIALYECLCYDREWYPRV